MTAVLASPDGLSIAVAAFDRVGAEGSDDTRVLLLRADCAL